MVTTIQHLVGFRSFLLEKYLHPHSLSLICQVPSFQHTPPRGPWQIDPVSNTYIPNSQECLSELNYFIISGGAQALLHP